MTGTGQATDTHMRTPSGASVCTQWAAHTHVDMFLIRPSCNFSH